jgi:hypothetical protein
MLLLRCDDGCLLALATGAAAAGSGRGRFSGVYRKETNEDSHSNGIDSQRHEPVDGEEGIENGFACLLCPI